jgi:hypothetical protein
VTSTQPGPTTPESSGRAAVVVPRGATGRARLLSAASAVGVVLLARFVLGLLAMVGSAVGFSVTAFPSGFTATPVGQFLGGFAFYPFPFYVVAFLVLLLVRPIEAATPLDRVLRHAVVAGAAGTLALAVVGIVPGVLLSRSGNTWANLVLYVTTIPLAAGVIDTALLVVGCVLAWLWAHHDGAPATPAGAATGETAVTAPPAGGDVAGEQPASPSGAETPSARHPEPAASAEPAPSSGPVRPVLQSGPSEAVPRAGSDAEVATTPVDAGPRRARRAPAADDWSRYAPPAESPVRPDRLEDEA